MQMGGTVKARILGIVLATVMVMGLTSGVASAKKPLDVDCNLLEATNDAVDDFLDGEGIQFNNLGDLVSSATLDDAVFDQLSDLILLFSGGEIEFTSASQAVSTNAKCGLVPQLVGNVSD
jgi:hypothetical protein